MALADGVSFTAASAGTGAFGFGTARASFLTLAQAVTQGELIDGQTVSYLAQDSLSAPTQREWGHGTFHAGSNTISRTTVLGTVNNGVAGSGSPLSFTVTPIVSLTVLAEDLNATGTVTSVGLSAPAIFSVSGSPVTNSGTLALSLATQSANLVFGGPSSGSAAAPTFRSLVANDIPGTLNATAIGAGSAITSSGPGGALASGAFTAAYSLPTASTSVLGGVKVDGTTITISSGVISAAGGGVSSVSNSDGSLTISPTTGAVIASLNAAHANTWSAQQTFSNSSSSGAIAISSTTDSTSTASGALVCSGGVGIAKNLYVGENIVLPSATSSTVGNLTVGGAPLFALNLGGYPSLFWGYGCGNYSETGILNVGIGWSALSNLTSGQRNTALGYACGYALTTGSYNVFLGHGVGNVAQAGGYNVGIGQGVFGANLSNTAGYNVGLGNATLAALTSGGNNLGIGSQSFQNLTTGLNNTGIGYQAGNNYTGAESYNTIIGNLLGTVGESSTVQIGNGNSHLAFDYNHTRTSWATLPDQTQLTNTTDSSSTTTGALICSGGVGIAKNLQVGKNVVLPQSTSSSIGVMELYDEYFFSPQFTTLCIGYQSGNWSLTGQGNYCFGYNTGHALTSGTNDTLLGYQAGQSLTSGSNNTLVGYNAGHSLVTDSGATIIGSHAGMVGAGEQFIAATGSSGDVAVAVYGTNVIVGVSAGAALGASGNNATLVGYTAGLSITAGATLLHTAIGCGAGYNMNSTVSGLGGGGPNTLIGGNAGYNLTTGGANTLVGLNAARNLTTGQRNIVVSNGYSAVGAPSSWTGAETANTILAGYGLAGTSGESNTIQIGDGDGNLRLDYGHTNANGWSLASGFVVGSATGGYKGAGTINVATGIYLNNTAYTNPDFVLEHYFTGQIKKFADKPRAKDYRGLMPLDELQAYARENLRLPRISDEPADIFERGDIALEKLEEAHIYILQLHARVKALEEARHGD